MSSDSRASHPSAHNHDQDVVDVEDIADHDLIEEEHTVEEGASEAHNKDSEDAADTESISHGSEGLTFARTRRSFPREDEDESASGLSIRPRIERPGSPESTSIPDDTPSIQAR